MIIFFIRIGLIAIIALLGIKCIAVNTFGPMLTGYFLLAVAGAWVVIELILAVEQIMNERSEGMGAKRLVNEEDIDD